MESLSSTRFKDQNFVLRHFKGHIAVCCPKCQHKAEVVTDFQTYNSRFYCTNCYYQLDKSLVYYDLSLKVFCNQCAHRIVVEIPEVKHKKQSIRVRCPECGQVEAYQPTYTEYQGYSFSYADGLDPFFKLPLWYQTPFKDELLWAYNAEHLVYLQEYVSAKLRERNHRLHMTLVERLPQFLKSAKNREEIGKLLERMKYKQQ